LFNDFFKKLNSTHKLKDKNLPVGFVQFPAASRACGSNNSARLIDLKLNINIKN